MADEEKSLKYVSSVRSFPASPRSKRLRELGLQGASLEVIKGGGSSSGSNSSGVVGDGHYHANKSTLDKQSDAEGYLYLSALVENENDEYERVEEKVKAGYADEAGKAEHAKTAELADKAKDLTDDSPVYKRFLRKDQDDTAAGHITFEQGIDVAGDAGIGGNITVKGDAAIKGSVTANRQSLFRKGLVVNAPLIEDSEDEITTASFDGIIEDYAERSGEGGATTLGGLDNVDEDADIAEPGSVLVSEDGFLWKAVPEAFLPTGTAPDGTEVRNFQDLMNYIAANGGGGGTAVQRNVRIVNNLDGKSISASKGEPCYLNFTFVSQERYDSSEPYEDTGERGLCEISVKTPDSTSYTVVKEMYINSGIPTVADVSEYLISGANQVMIKVTGEVTEVITPAFVYTVQLTSLSVSADNFRWWTAYMGNITLPLNIGGNVSKMLYVTVAGENYSESYQTAIGTGVYTETAYNYVIPHPKQTGVYKISAYVSNVDGSIKTRAVTFNIICALAGDYTKLVAVNNVIAKAVNWSENALFEYAMYEGDAVNTSARFTIMKDGENVFVSDEDSITTSAKHTFSLPLEIETMDNTDFDIVADITDSGVKLTPSILLPVNNSLGYSAMPGAILYVNPKTRSNSQANYKSVINETNGSSIEATWENMNWGNDGWITDEAGSRVLRLMAGSLLTMDYKPFEKECARTGKTIEIDYRVDNVTDYREPVITLSSPHGNSFVGLNIYADDVIMHSQSLKDDSVQSLHTFEGKRTRLALTIVPDAYGTPGFNLCILYVNGVKNREFTYENNDYFAHNGNIIIGSDYADVDIYGIREYNSGLSSQGVLTNYINWLADTTEKLLVKDENNILDANGSEISYENTKDKYNTMVFDTIIPSMADQTQRVGNLLVNWTDHPEWNSYITNVTAKGQGTSSMKYWIWNTRYQLDKNLSVVTYGDGSQSTGKWQMTPFLLAGRKYTAKKNFASCMQSHKIGSVNSYTDLVREMNLLNEAMEMDAKARVSVWQAPFICFEKAINDEGEEVYTFRGLYTFGPDKGDDDTFKFDTSLFPKLLSTEGSDNSPLATLFRVPWNPAKPYFTYNEDTEAWQYNGANSWNYGTGKVENISAFIPVYNFVYECSPRLQPFNGTVEELNAQVVVLRNEPYEFWIAKVGDANQYNVYYYEASEGRFIPSDTGEGTINLLQQLAGKEYGLNEADLTGKTINQVNELFIAARIAKFRVEASEYWHIEDTLTFMNNVELNAGTDERAKNTYPYSFNLDTSTWRWRADDTDTRFDTTNRGLPEKSYSVETHDTDETGAAIWNGETNNLFNLMELAFPEEKVSNMRRQLAAMQTLGGLKSGNDLEKLYAFYRKYFFDEAQEYFPANAYNADAKYCYENGKLAYMAGAYSNDTDPITQSLGDHYLAEQRWITKRLLYMMSKYSFGLFSAAGTDTITVRAAGNTIGYDLTPAMDLYPAIANGTSIIRGERTKAGEICHMEIELSGSGDQQNAIMGAGYLQDIGDWHDKNVQGSMIVQGRMLREIRLGHKSEPIVITISSLTLSNCVSLQKLLLSRISTLSGTLNLTGCTHLKEVYIDGTSVTQLRLPEGGGLEKVEFNALSQYLILKNYPLLKNEGVIIDECKSSITDFLIQGCPSLNPMRLLVDIMEAQENQVDNHALKRVRAVGFDEEFDSSDMLDKLATLADGSYVGLSSEGIAGEDELPVLDGTLTVNASAYEDSVEALRGTFSKLNLNVTGPYYIRFEDDEVRRICAENWGDGMGITKEQAAAVTGDIGSKFRNNTEINSFDELRYFTNAKADNIYDTALTKIIYSYAYNNLLLLKIAYKDIIVDYVKIMDGGANSISIQGGNYDRYNYIKLVYLPSNVAWFHDYVFRNIKIDKLYMNREIPPKLSFGWGSGLSNVGIIYVPVGSVNSYKEAAAWNTYNNYVEYDFETDIDGVRPPII